MLLLLLFIVAAKFEVSPVCPFSVAVMCLRSGSVPTGHTGAPDSWRLGVWE